MAITAGQPALASDFIETSAGAADEGKVPKLNASGVLDKTFVPTGFSTTEVFSGTAPTSYTDLDLSAVVGVGQRIVMLRVFGNAAGTLYAMFRPNGTNYTQQDASSTAAGVSRTSTMGADPDGCFVIVKTDTAGVIEWKANTGAVKIEVMAYW